MEIPQKFNASTFLLDRHLQQGKGEKTAIICQDRELTYREVYKKVNCFGNALLKLGVEMENRVAVLSPDIPEVIITMLASMRLGAIPIIINTMLPSQDISFILNDSRAKAVVVHESLLKKVKACKDSLKFLKHLIIIGHTDPNQLSFEGLMKNMPDELEPAETSRDDSVIWQYSSGTTGSPKGIIQLHRNIPHHFRCHGEGILKMSERDRVFSIAKLFFGYGQSSSFFWPFCAGATTLLLPERPEPVTTAQFITNHKPTVFCGVPTSYNAILQLPGLKEKYDFSSVRVFTSAGESLPIPVYDSWLNTFGAEIIDGIGSTECFHIFISNRPGSVVPGSSGKPIPGFEARVVDDEGNSLPPGEIGNLMVKGDSMAAGYWNNRDLTRRTFLGGWIKTGDKFACDEDGNFWYAGRNDDMIKAGGIWVSPIEVENVLLSHPTIDECGVIGLEDADGLMKPKAYVVLKKKYVPSDALSQEIKEYVKTKIAPYKYPRWIEYIEALPKTTTGKLQRFKLRQLDAN